MQPINVFISLLHFLLPLASAQAATKLTPAQSSIVGPDIAAYVSSLTNAPAYTGCILPQLPNDILPNLEIMPAFVEIISTLTVSDSHTTVAERSVYMDSLPTHIRSWIGSVAAAEQSIIDKDDGATGAMAQTTNVSAPPSVSTTDACGVPPQTIPTAHGGSALPLTTESPISGMVSQTTVVPSSGTGSMATTDSTSATQTTNVPPSSIAAAATAGGSVGWIGMGLLVGVAGVGML